MGISDVRPMLPLYAWNAWLSGRNMVALSPLSKRKKGKQLERESEKRKEQRKNKNKKNKNKRKEKEKKKKKKKKKKQPRELALSVTLLPRGNPDGRYWTWPLTSSKKQKRVPSRCPFGQFGDWRAGDRRKRIINDYTNVLKIGKSNAWRDTIMCMRNSCLHGVNGLQANHVSNVLRLSTPAGIRSSMAWHKHGGRRILSGVIGRSGRWWDS